MNRLSGTYKRRAQLLAFIIGFILAMILNVDSINVASSLWREPTLRQAIVAEAQNYTPPVTSQSTPGAAPLQDIPALKTQLQSLNIPFGWNFAAFNPGEKKCALLPIQPGQIVGIAVRDASGQSICNGINNLPSDPNSWAAKLLGMLITGAAAAQGAPFWFDILKKLVNVRGTGAKPEEQKCCWVKINYNSPILSKGNGSPGTPENKHIGSFSRICIILAATPANQGTQACQVKSISVQPGSLFWRPKKLCPQNST